MPHRERNRTTPLVGPIRLRRGRRTGPLRDFLAEGQLQPRQLVLPVFVGVGTGSPRPIPSMPGVERYPLGRLASLAAAVRESGLRCVLLFGDAAHKDPFGKGAWAERGAVPLAVRELKRATPDLIVITDVCLCAHTTHGHCGVLDRGGEVDNDRTLPVLARIAVSHARAGADFVAPSAMMDGQVRHLRAALDGAGYPGVGIVAYSTKHASAFYGPFRDAEGSAPTTGDRRGYQMDWRNGREALRELAADAEEGADILMVKPGLTSLDLLARARERFDLPLAAFQVSGEYAAIKAAAARGFLDERAAVEETLGAMHRAGADLVITYYAREAARWAAERP